MYYFLPELAPTLHLAIINVQDKELVMDIGSSLEILDLRIAQFLWIRLETATKDEVVGFDLGPGPMNTVTIS